MTFADLTAKLTTKLESVDGSLIGKIFLDDAVQEMVGEQHISDVDLMRMIADDPILGELKESLEVSNVFVAARVAIRDHLWDYGWDVAKEIFGEDVFIW